MSARLRRRETSALDWDNVAEEIEALGRNQRHELKSRLRVPIARLLKWRFQADMREDASWKATILEQRR